MQEDSDFDLEVEVSEDVVEDDVQEEQEDSEATESEAKATSEGVEREKSGWVDLDKIPEELRESVKGRFGEYARKAAKSEFKARQLEAENRELKAKLEKTDPPKEIPMPSYELAIENPEEFNRQNRAYNDSLIAKRDYDAAIKAQEERSLALQKEQQDKAIESYYKKAQKLGIDTEILAEAQRNLDDAGLFKQIGNFLVTDEDGPALVKELNSDFLELHEISLMTPERMISYIERNVRPRLSKVKKPSAPPPPTKVAGSRGTGTKTVYDKHGFTIE